MKTTRQLALATVASLIALQAPAAAATTDLQPEDLPRGSDIAIAHIEDGDLVAGRRTYVVGGDRAYLLGRSGSAWIVGTTSANGQSHRRIKRVSPDGTIRTLLKGIEPYNVVVSEDGRRLVRSKYVRGRSVVKLWSARSGKLKVARTFDEVYDAPAARSGRKVLLSGWESGVAWWDTVTGSITRVTKRPLNAVDLGSDRLASYTDDPYQGGCTKVTPLSAPRHVLWKSCDERVVAFSPDGDRMATIGILSDGLGPAEVTVREIGGDRLASYRTNWFGAVEWESDTRLLLEVNGQTRSSTVRCEVDDCENATDPVPVQAPRTVAPRRQLVRQSPRG